MEELTKMIESVGRKLDFYWKVLESLEAVKESEEKKKPVQKLLTITKETMEIITKRFKRFYLLIITDENEDEFIKRLFKSAAENNKYHDVAYGVLDAKEHGDLAKELLSKDTISGAEILCLENGRPKNSIWCLKIEDILKDAIVKACERL